MSTSKKRQREDATNAAIVQEEDEEEEEEEEEQYDPPFNCPKGKEINECQKEAIPNEFPIGCGKRLLAADHVEALRTLSHMIVDKIEMVSWGEGLHVDQKIRGYAMLENSQKWSNVDQLVQAGILLHDEDGENDPDPVVRQEAQLKHEITKTKAFTNIHLSPTQLAAVNAIITCAQDIVRDWPTDEIKSYERDCIKIAELVAIQPNIHNHDPLLPLHLDQPRHDGFGIVIVTVGIEGSGDIVLNDTGPDTTSLHRNWSFPLQPGELYVLCGPSRNLCRHGVIGHTNTGNDRISLNLRFGVHTQHQAHEDIGSKWI